jgi:sugar phosphate permease
VLTPVIRINAMSKKITPKQENIPLIIRLYQKNRIHVFLLLFLSYVGFYFCRVNLLAALPLIEDAFHFTKTQTGLILSSYFIVYSFGKIINGLFGDKIGGKAMLIIGIGGSVICNIIFGFGRELRFFVIIWSINAFFQSMGWLSMVSIMSHWYTSVESGRAMGIISLSYLLGDFAARSSAGIVVAREGARWSELFWLHAAILAGIGLIAWIFVRPYPEKLGLLDVDAYAMHIDSDIQNRMMTKNQKPAERQTAKPKSWMHFMLANKWFWLVCTIYFGLSIIRYIFWSWSIFYLKENGLRTSSAIIASAVFPILGSLGAIFAGWVSDKMNARRGPVIVLMTSCMVLSIFIFSRIPRDNPVLLVVTLAVIGFTLIGPYSLLAGAMAIDFGSKHSAAAASGIIDAVGAFGAVFSGAGMGHLIDKYEWNGAFMIVLGIALLTALLCVPIWKLTPLRETENA